MSAYDGQTLGRATRTDATDFPIFQKYDGVDDGMATAAFTAGTLTSAMDCMIAVRRDSAAACVAGLYNGIADATKFFGMARVQVVRDVLAQALALQPYGLTTLNLRVGRQSRGARCTLR
jgi:hypothetical protein